MITQNDLRTLESKKKLWQIITIESEKDEVWSFILDKEAWKYVFLSTFVKVFFKVLFLIEILLLLTIIVDWVSDKQ